MIEFSVDACDPETYAVVRKGLEWDDAGRKRQAHAVAAQRVAQPAPRSSPPRWRSTASTSMRSRNIWVEGIGVDYLIKRKFLTWGVNTTLDASRSADPAAYLNTDEVPVPVHLRAAEHRLARQRHGVRLRHLGQHQHGQRQHGDRSATSGTARVSASIATSTWPGAARTSPCAPAVPTGSIAPGSTTTGRSSRTPRRRASSKLGRLGEHDDFRGVMDGGTSK